MTFAIDIRTKAATATREAFIDQGFVWGTRDCVRLAAHALKGLGYKPALVRGGFYTTALGAQRAIRKAGYPSIEAALDGLGLARLPWSYALPGDIVALPSSERWPALAVVMDYQHVLAFSALDGTCRIARPKAEEILALWSAPPLGV